MSLYLCIFDGEAEVDGVDVGSYSDFDVLRETIAANLEAGVAGGLYPTLMLHVDSDGEWTAQECVALRKEIQDIAERMKTMPSAGYGSDWQRAVSKSLGLQPNSLHDCFIDVDGEALLQRLLVLAEKAITTQRPILFQ